MARGHAPHPIGPLLEIRQHFPGYHVMPGQIPGQIFELEARIRDCRDDIAQRVRPVSTDVMIEKYRS
jgi:hypothetical protein